MCNCYECFKCQDVILERFEFLMRHSIDTTDISFTKPMVLRKSSRCECRFMLGSG
jgi:hypothetical protein